MSEIHPLRRVWRGDSWPRGTRPGRLEFSPTGARIALGSSFQLTVSGDSTGALTVYDAATGAAVHRIADDWVAGPILFSLNGLLMVEQRFREIGQVGEGRVRVLDTDTFLERANHAVAFQAPVFSPDGRLLVDDSHAPFVFDLAEGVELWRASRNIAGVAWSPDSASIALGSTLDGSAAVTVVDAVTGDARFVTHTPSGVNALAYTSDGRRVVAGGRAGTGCVITAFDAASGTRLWTTRLEGAARMVSFAVSADARWLAALGLPSSGGPAVLDVFDLEDGTPRFPPVPVETSAGGDPGPLLYSPTLRHLVVPTGEKVVVLDAGTGGEHARLDGGFTALAPDGGTLVVTVRPNPFGFEGFVERYDLGAEVARHTVDATPTVVAVPAGESSLVAVADTSAGVVVVDAATGARMARKPVPGTVSSVVFADHGQAVAVGGSAGVRLFSVIGTRTWKVDDIGAVNALASVGNGEWVATAGGRALRLLNSADGTARWPAPLTHPQTVTRVAAGSSGAWVATGCADRRTRLVDAITGAVVFAHDGDGAVRSLAFAPFGTVLATANEDGTVVLVNAQAAAELGRITRPFGCAKVAFGAGGALLVTAWDDGMVAVVDLTDSTNPRTVREFALGGQAEQLAAVPVGDVVALSVAGAAGIRTLRDGGELVRILQPVPVRHLAFTAAGALLVTTSDDGVVRAWQSGLPSRQTT